MSTRTEHAAPEATYPPPLTTDGADHAHDPETCAACRRQADLFFDGGVRAEEARAAGLREAPQYREAVEWLSRSYHNVAVGLHGSRFFEDCPNARCVKYRALLAAPGDER